MSIPLDGLGMKGCTLLTTPRIDFAAGTGPGGMSEFRLPVPDDIALAGVTLQFQWFPFDRTATAFGFTASNALEIKIGQPWVGHK